MIPAENFTLSNMILPPGAEGPMHLHVDAEEVFFVLRGKIKVMTEKDGERWEAVLGERDCVSVAARRLSRRSQHRRGRSDHDGDDRVAKAGDADLSAGTSAVESQTLTSSVRSKPRRRRYPRGGRRYVRARQP